MYAIIGAGPAGLAAARQLQKYGIPFTGFELHGDVGGLWDIDNPHSTLYHSAHLISSKGTTQFDDFPMDMDVPPYPHHTQVLGYLQAYARHFGLHRHYRFNTRVTALLRQERGWRLRCERDGEVQEGLFDGVLIANGTLHTPNRPELPGEFSGEILHASQYRSADCFEGKRVLIVGCGNSACDIAVDAVHRARSVDLSVRRGYHFLPKFCLGRPIDTFGNRVRLPRPLKQRLDAALLRLLIGRPSDYGLPDPDHRLYESHPVVNSLVLHHLVHGDIRARRDVRSLEGQRVVFSDGERQDYDLILLATGYHLDYPFIDRGLLNWPRDCAAPQLYLNAFHPQYDDLFVLGMLEASGLGWQGRAEQAELVALYIRQLAAGNPAAERFRQLKRMLAGQRIDGGYRYLPLERMAHYVDKNSYRRSVREHIAELRRDLPRTAPLQPLPAHGAS